MYFYCGIRLPSGEAETESSLGACRIYREAVKDHSPGLQAWGSHARGKRPEGAADWASIVRPLNISRTVGVQTHSVALTGRFSFVWLTQA